MKRGPIQPGDKPMAITVEQSKPAEVKSPITETMDVDSEMEDKKDGKPKRSASCKRRIRRLRLKSAMKAKALQPSSTQVRQ